MPDFAYRARLRTAREIKAIIHRPLSTYFSPFAEGTRRTPLIHRCYHKVGTVWFGRILRHIAAEFGLTFQSGNHRAVIKDYEVGQRADVFLDIGSHVHLNRLEEYCGSHMIRDPRDLIVSAYFYHKWTNEPWANKQRAVYNNMTYKQYLNSLNKEDGISLEMKNSEFWINHMASWDFSDPNIFEIRYENIIHNEHAVFPAMFRFYGFSEKAIRKSCAIARKYSLDAFTKKGGVGVGSHLRSGQPRQWQLHFSPDHTAQFKRLYPGALSRLGYELNDRW